MNAPAVHLLVVIAACVAISFAINRVTRKGMS